ncbi:DUF5133 domain-containing protein [Streptomyces sp. NPDC001658]
MLIPRPGFLRELVEAYEALAAEEAAAGRTEPSPRARDLAYTLCVSTGTRDVRPALETARRLLAAAQEGEPGQDHEPAPNREPALRRKPLQDRHFVQDREPAQEREPAS